MPAVLVSEDLEQIMQSYIPSRNVPDLNLYVFQIFLVHTPKNVAFLPCTSPLLAIPR